MRNKLARSSGLLCALLLLSPHLASAQESLLDQAYNYLEHDDASGAAQLVRTYLASNPRRYRADFLAAVAACKLAPGSPSARQKIAAVKDDYVLTADAQQQVDAWIAQCAGVRAAAPGRTSPDGESFVADYVRKRPVPLTIASAAANEPNPAPARRMSGLVDGTSYSGDDYAEFRGVATASDCAQLCRAQAPCRSMTYARSTRTCWLKRSVPPAQQGGDFVSASKIMN